MSFFYSCGLQIYLRIKVTSDYFKIWISQMNNKWNLKASFQVRTSNCLLYFQTKLFSANIQYFGLSFPATVTDFYWFWKTYYHTSYLMSEQLTCHIWLFFEMRKFQKGDTLLNFGTSNNLLLKTMGMFKWFEVPTTYSLNINIQYNELWISEFLVKWSQI